MCVLLFCVLCFVFAGRYLFRPAYFSCFLFFAQTKRRKKYFFALYNVIFTKNVYFSILNHCVK